MVYNGRRPGEIERIQISDFQECHQEHNDLFSEKNREGDQYKRCVLRGKLGRNVSIILSMREITCINMILNNRELAGVQIVNPYIFG